MLRPLGEGLSHLYRGVVASLLFKTGSRSQRTVRRLTEKASRYPPAARVFHILKSSWPQTFARIRAKILAEPSYLGRSRYERLVWTQTEETASLSVRLKKKTSDHQRTPEL